MDNNDEAPPRGGILWRRLLMGLSVAAVGAMLLFYCIMIQFPNEDASGLGVIFQAMLGYLILSGGVVLCDSARP